jgi:hypothetical protein
MFLSRIVFKSTNHKKYLQRKRMFQSILLMKPLSILAQYIWLWIATIESESKNILPTSISKERNMFVAEYLLSNIVENYGKHAGIYRWWNMVPAARLSFIEPPPSYTFLHMRKV